VAQDSDTTIQPLSSDRAQKLDGMPTSPLFRAQSDHPTVILAALLRVHHNGSFVRVKPASTVYCPSRLTSG